MNGLPEKVLLATDGSEDAALAARAAADLASRSEAELHVAHAWHDVPSPHAHRYIERELRLQGQQILDGQVAVAEKLGSGAVERHLVKGRTVEAILWIAGEIPADLVVLGSRGLGFVGRLTLGSVSEAIARRAGCPVLVMRGEATGGAGAWPPARIVVGDDGSEESRRAGVLAARLGALYGAQTLLVRAGPKEVGDDWGLEHEMERTSGAAPAVRPMEKLATEAILEVAGESPSLIAVGCHGRGGVSAEVMRAARGPVLVASRSRQGPEGGDAET